MKRLGLARSFRSKGRVAALTGVVLFSCLPAVQVHAFAFYQDRVKQFQPPGAGAPVTVPDPYYWAKCAQNNLNGGACALNITFNLALPLNQAGKGALNLAVDTWQARTVAPNQRQPGNLGVLGANDPVHSHGRQNFDLQTTLVHELGHALGLDHPEMGRDRPVDSTGRPVAFQQARFTASTFGANNRYEFDANGDIPGNANDLRGDDMSLHLVDADNNPFNVGPARIDRSTFSLHKLFNQPKPNSYARAPTREVAREIANNPDLALESVMVQDWAADETRRILTHDDVNGLRYLESGRDQDATAVADNFTFNFIYDARGARGGANNAPPAGIDVLLSDFPNLDERPSFEPFIDRRGFFSDVIISLAYGAASESDLLFGTGDRYLLGRTDTWLDSNGMIAFVDVIVDRGTVNEPRTVALLGLALVALYWRRRNPS